MEEILVIALQIFFEFVLQLFGSGLVSSASTTTNTKTEDGFVTFFLHASIGGLCGYLSTLLAPKLVLPLPGLRIANLIAAPCLAGGVSVLIGKWFEWKTKPATLFWHGFLFALMFGAARLAFAHR